MPKKPIFDVLELHIGTHKTGTSAIQMTVFENRESLMELNRYYPLAGLWKDKSHHKWSYAIWDVESGQNKLDHLFEELEGELGDLDKEFSIAVMSSELIEKAVLKDGVKDNLAYFLSRIARKIRVTAFFRRQDLLVESVFKQWVKDPAVRLNKQVEKFVSVQAPNLNYLAVTQAWEALEATEIVSVRLYSKAMNPVSEFFKILLPGSNYVPAKTAEKIVNPSLDGKALEFKYLINKIDLSPEEDFRLLSFITQKVEVTESLDLFGADDRQVYMQQFEESNSRLFDRFALEPFSNMNINSNRTISPLSGREVLGFLNSIAEENERLVWKIVNKLSYR